MSTAENTPEPDTSLPSATLPAAPPADADQPAPNAADPALDDAMRSIRGVGENLRGED